MAGAKETEKYTLNEFINEANRKLESVYVKPSKNKTRKNIDEDDSFTYKWRINFYISYGTDEGDKISLDDFAIKCINNPINDISNLVEPYIRLLKKEKGYLEKERMKNYFQNVDYDINTVRQIHEIRNKIGNLDPSAREGLKENCQANVKKSIGSIKNIRKGILELDNKYNFWSYKSKSISAFYKRLDKYRRKYFDRCWNKEYPARIGVFNGENYPLPPENIINSIFDFKNNTYIIFASKKLYFAFNDIKELFYWGELMLAVLYFIKIIDSPALPKKDIQKIKNWEKEYKDHWLIHETIPEDKKEGKDSVSIKDTEQLGFLSDKYEKFKPDEDSKAIDLSSTPILSKAYKKLINKLISEGKEDHFTARQAKKYLVEIDKTHDIHHDNKSLTDYFKTKQNSKFRPIFDKVFNHPKGSQIYSIDKDYLP
jgi:hypothetical protein